MKNDVENISVKVNVNFNGEVPDELPKIKWWLSWPFIMIIFAAFWPISLLLIWIRTTVDKKTALNSGKIIRRFGWGGLAYIIYRIFLGISEGFASGSISAIIFLCVAIPVYLLLGKKINDDAEKTKKYIAIVINNEITDIDKVAESIPTTYDIAKKDLQKMIDKGYFTGAYIDEKERQIKLPKKHQSSSSNKSNTAKMRVVTCTSCGAKNSIATGTVKNCEYCGSKLEG